MANAPINEFWKEERPREASIPMSRVYLAQDAGGVWTFSTVAADQDATLALKSGQLFIDTGVTNGGILAQTTGGLLVTISVPASTT